MNNMNAPSKIHILLLRWILSVVSDLIHIPFKLLEYLSKLGTQRNTSFEFILHYLHNLPKTTATIQNEENGKFSLSADGYTNMPIMLCVCSSMDILCVWISDFFLPFFSTLSNPILY